MIETRFTVESLLDYGRENAILIDELMKKTKNSRRQIMAAVEQERKGGAPICSATTYPAGYYLSNDPAEIRACVASLQRRSRNIWKTASFLKETANQIEKIGKPVPGDEVEPADEWE